MTDLVILATPKIKYFGDLHPFRKWRKQLHEAGINVEIFYDHTNPKVLNAERLLIHHRYFDSGWVNALKTASNSDSDFINYLKSLKTSVGKLIWFDAEDSTGSTQLAVIPYVDIFVKKQLLLDKNYYAGNPIETKNVRVWSDPSIEQKQFAPCRAEYLNKLAVGWNIAYNDYRDFKVHFNIRKYLSHFVSHNAFPINYSKVLSDRPYDISFRGTINYSTSNKDVSFQRNKVLELFSKLPYKIASGGSISRSKYLDEMNKSKVGISPFGYGEVCFRDFETFICGSILLKPSMSHLETFPNLYIPNETYVPLSWKLDDLEETLDNILSNYKSYEQIALNGQERYRSVMNDSHGFVNAVKRVIA
jgi:hypothetical protein